MSFEVQLGELSTVDCLWAVAYGLWTIIRGDKRSKWVNEPIADNHFLKAFTTNSNSIWVKFGPSFSTNISSN